MFFEKDNPFLTSLLQRCLRVRTTKNFTTFSDSRKFASYCGVAPFEHTSGSSIRATVATGKTKTSHLVNKPIKALLSNGAASAIQSDKGLKVYYHRKLSEGKPPMVVINAVRAKLINRVFAIRPGWLLTEVVNM